MSWFDTKGLASIAKNALKEAQKQIDKALDIQDEQMTVSTTKPTTGGDEVGSLPDKTATSVKQSLPAEKKLPGGANREKSNTEPNTPSVEPTAAISATWGSFTGSFFENPKAHEMVTTAPKACSSANMGVVEIMKPTGGKRQSLTSNSDNSQSVELLSPNTVSTSSELASPESVELITAPETTTATATSSEVTTPETDDSLPESIVIIATNEACDEEEDDSISYNTVMDDTLTAMSLDASLTSSAKILRQTSEDTKSLSASVVSKLVMSLDESQTIDSDSTQSFEDVQMQMSSGTLHGSLLQEDQETGGNSKATHHDDKTFHCSPPLSNDEMETTTSSDIEIISNTNGGDSSSQNSASRTSPLKLKKSNAGQCSSALLKKGHHREPSEISILSEDSQTDIDKLQHRLNELNDILEAREQRLLHSERQNAELLERNNELQTTLEALRSSNAGLDSSAEEYTQRVSALEKKFQLSIRERDSLRAQVKSLKDELQRKIPTEDLQAVVAENNDMIEALRLEGEKLSKEILQQSNIIKKLRVKEKSCDALLKKNKEELKSQCDELERLKKTLNAKDEMECTQIEAIHKISSEKRKLEEDCSQQRSKIDDLQMKLNTLQASFDAVKTELQQRVVLHTDLTRSSEEAMAARKAHDAVKSENVELQRQLSELREQLRSTEQQARRREQQLRDEKQQLLGQLEDAELRAETSTQDISLTSMPLMRQLESLQKTLSQRTSNWNQQEHMLLEKLAATENRLKSVEELENTSKEKLDLLQKRCMQLEDRLSQALMQEEKSKIALQQVQLDFNQQQNQHKKDLAQLKEILAEREKELSELAEVKKNLEELQQQQQQQQQQQNQLYKKDEEVNVFESLQRRYSADSDTLQAQAQRASSSANSASVNSVEDVLGGSMVDWQMDDLDYMSNSERNQNAPPASSLIYGMNLNIAGHNTSTLEHLQSLLKQRDGELAHLQWELSRLQAERAILNEEITQLTLELENLREKLLNLENLEESNAELQHRYDALLQMYGEKVERTEELELDLFELKEAYKTQISELLSK